MDPARLDVLVERLRAAPAGAAPEGVRQAAVAAALREAVNGPELLLMRRAERPGDRWSGQVSLPGGHAEPDDADLVETAVRETREEVGLDLTRDGRALGDLAPIQARARGLKVDLWITPVVFHYAGAGEFALGPEASDAFWMPLDAARRGDLDEPYPYLHEGTRLRLPGWRVGEHHVWGLTHRIVSTLLPLVH